MEQNHINYLDTCYEMLELTHTNVSYTLLASACMGHEINEPYLVALNKM